MLSAKEPRIYLFEKAHEAAVILRLALPVLDETERETLAILADPKTYDGILKGIEEAKKGELIPFEKVFQ